QPILETRVGAEINAVPVLGLLAEVSLKRRVRGAGAHLGRLDVVQSDDDVPAATGQPGVERRGHAIGIEVSSGETLQLRHLEVAEPTAEVADVDAKARRE